MKYIRNEDGIALVTALMFTLISLAMIMALMYYVLTGTKMSAAQKKYRSSLEASYGGTDVVTKIIIPRLFGNYSSGMASLAGDFGGTGINKLNLLINSGSGMSTATILSQKLNSATADWTSAAPFRSVDPKTMPDFVFTLKGQGTVDYNVYGKIVDTIAGVGLIDASGIDYLEAGLGVAGTSTSTQSPRTPNVYSVEIQGEAAVNPREKGGLSVLYAY